MGFAPPTPPAVEVFPTPVRSAYGRARHVLLCQARSTRRRQCRRYAVGIIGGAPRCQVHKEVPVSRKKAPANVPTIATQATHALQDGTKLVVRGDDYTLTVPTAGAETFTLASGSAAAIRSFVDGLVALIGVGLPKPKRVRNRKPPKEAAAA
jgi:hypothetical protein